MWNSIVLIGNGNLSFQLQHELKNKAIEFSLVDRKQPDYESKLIAIENAVIFILVPDDSIQELCKKLKKNNFVIHCSGSVDINLLSDFKQYGIFYPLQTFTKTKIISFNEIPILIEASDDTSLSQIDSFSKKIAKTVIIKDSSTRKKIHLTAVYVNNFVNFILDEAKKIASTNEIDFSLFKPLLEETVLKSLSISLIDVQTGPAKRGDYSTMKQHLMLLPEDQKEIYTYLSNKILEKYSHEKL